VPGPPRFAAPLLLPLQQLLEGAAASARVRAPRALLLFGPGRERAAPLLIAFLAQEQMAAVGATLSRSGAAAEADRAILDRDRDTLTPAAAGQEKGSSNWMGKDPPETTWVRKVFPGIFPSPMGSHSWRQTLSRGFKCSRGTGDGSLSWTTTVCGRSGLRCHPIRRIRQMRNPMPGTMSEGDTDDERRLPPRPRAVGKQVGQYLDPQRL